jgi:hypothetical protein
VGAAAVAASAAVATIGRGIGDVADARLGVIRAVRRRGGDVVQELMARIREEKNV